MRLITALLISASFPLPLLAQNPDEYSGIIISEVYSNAEGNERDGIGIDEFIELYNPSDQPQILSNAKIVKDNYTLELPSIILQPKQQITLFPKTPDAEIFSLANSGGTIKLLVDQLEVQQIAYDTLKEKESCNTTPTNGQWVCNIAGYSPSPELSNNEFYTEPVPVIEDPVYTPCLAPNIAITEILANPAGADSAGGEFVELYNSGDKDLTLLNCQLHTDKQDKIELNDYTVKAKSYLAVNLADKLLNDGGEVWFVASDREDIVEYPALKSGLAFALIGTTWQITNQPTANSVNLPNAVEIEKEESTDDTTAKTCPDGKYLNTATNRCKNIVAEAAEVIPCAIGYTRNPQTNRCRKTVTSGSTAELSACKDGYERNPDTNRCRKIASTSTSSTVATDKNNNNQDSATQEISARLLTPAAALAMMFGLYEYREDARHHVHKIKKHVTKNKSR